MLRTFDDWNFYCTFSTCLLPHYGFLFFSGIIGKVRNSDEQVGKRASVKDPNKMKGKKREE